MFCVVLGCGPCKAMRLLGARQMLGKKKPVGAVTTSKSHSKFSSCRKCSTSSGVLRELLSNVRGWVPVESFTKQTDW